jgi:hypothetical protein
MGKMNEYVQRGARPTAPFPADRESHVPAEILMAGPERAHATTLSFPRTRESRSDCLPRFLAFASYPYAGLLLQYSCEG